MADVEGERRLIEVAPPHLYAYGIAAQGLPSIGPDHQAGSKRLVLTRDDGDDAVLRHHCRCLVVDTRQPRKLCRPRLQRGNEAAVFDIEAELLQADFLGREANLWRSAQAAGIAYEPHHSHRRST